MDVWVIVKYDASGGYIDVEDVFPNEEAAIKHVEDDVSKTNNHIYHSSRYSLADIVIMSDSKYQYYIFKRSLLK